MVLHGRVENGAVVLSDGLSLPDGTEVTVIVQPIRDSPAEKSSDRDRRVKLPLVAAKKPGSLRLNSEDVAEFLNDDDLSA